MPGLMKPRNRGLFGALADAPQPPPTATAQPMKPKFFDEGGIGRTIAGSVGDALLQLGGAQPIFAPAMQEQRRYQMQEANRLRDFQNQRDLIDYKRQNPEPDYFDDNAGNRWSINPATGERKLIFRDPNAKRIPQKTYGPNGEEYIEYIEIPNNVNEDGSFRASAAPMPQLPEGYTVRGGTGAPPISQAPARVQTSSVPSILGYNTQSNVVSPQEYQTLVLSMGRANADAYIRRQGLTVGGQ